MTKKDQFSKDSRVTRLAVHAPVPEGKKGKRKQTRRIIGEMPDGPVKSALNADLKGKCRQDSFKADFKAKAKGQCYDRLATYTANKCNVPPSQFTPLKPGLMEKPTSSRHGEKFGESPKKFLAHGQTSLLAQQSRTKSVHVPVVGGIFSEGVAVSTTSSFNSKRAPEKFPSTLAPTPSNDQSNRGNQNAEGKVIVPVVASNKVEESSKKLAEETSCVVAGTSGHATTFSYCLKMFRDRG